MFWHSLVAAIGGRGSLDTKEISAVQAAEGSGAGRPCAVVSVLRAGLARGLLRRQCRHERAVQFRWFLVSRFPARKGAALLRFPPGPWK